MNKKTDCEAHPLQRCFAQLLSLMICAMLSSAATKIHHNIAKMWDEKLSLVMFVSFMFKMIIKHLRKWKNCRIYDTIKGQSMNINWKEDMQGLCENLLINLWTKVIERNFYEHLQWPVHPHCWHYCLYVCIKMIPKCSQKYISFRMILLRKIFPVNHYHAVYQLHPQISTSYEVCSCNPANFNHVFLIHHLTNFHRFPTFTQHFSMWNITGDYISS